MKLKAEFRVPPTADPGTPKSAAYLLVADPDVSLSLSVATTATNAVKWRFITPKKEFEFECSTPEEKEDWFRSVRYTMEGTVPPVFVNVRAPARCRRRRRRRRVGLQANTHSLWLCLWLCLSCASRASGIRLRRSFPRSSPSTRSSRLARRPWSKRYRALSLSLSHWYHSSILTHDTGVRLPEQRAYDESIRNWLTDNTYLRFLKARNWVVDDAFKQLDDTLKWRSEVRGSRGIAPGSHSRSHSHCA